MIAERVPMRNNLDVASMTRKSRFGSSFRGLVPKS